MVEQPDRELARGQPDLLLTVAVDHVVGARGSGAPRLAAGRRAAGFPLQLERDVLGHVTHPGAVPQPLDEATGPVEGTAVIMQPRQQVDQRVREGRERVRGPVLERAKIDEQADGGLIGPEVGPAQDLAFEDLEVGFGWRLIGDGLVFGVLVALDSRVRARTAHSEALRSS